MNQEEIWDSIAEGWSNFRQKIYEKELYNLKWKKGKLLDLGCGNCRNLLPFKNLRLYGIDFSKEMLIQAKKYCDKYNIKVNFFDYCLCLVSLHIMNKEDADKSLKEIYRILKEGGQCLVSVWNKYGLLSFFIKERGKYIPWHKSDKIYNRYYYFYNYFGFRKLLLKNNFKIIKSGKILSRNITFLIQK